jgi:hypothetical protein
MLVLSVGFDDTAHEAADRNSFSVALRKRKNP